MKSAPIASTDLDPAQVQQLADKLGQLNHLRKLVQEAKQELERLLADPTIQEQRERVAMRAIATNQCDGEVRLLVQRLLEGKAQKRLLGCELVQRRTVVILDSARLFEHCLKHNHGLLILNESKLNDLMLKVGDDALVEAGLVEVTSYPSVRIPSNLDKLVEEVSHE